MSNRPTRYLSSSLRGKVFFGRFPDSVSAYSWLLIFSSKANDAHNECAQGDHREPPADNEAQAHRAGR